MTAFSVRLSSGQNLYENKASTHVWHAHIVFMDGSVLGPEQTLNQSTQLHASAGYMLTTASFLSVQYVALQDDITTEIGTGSMPDGIHEILRMSLSGAACSRFHRELSTRPAVCRQSQPFMRYCGSWACPVPPKPVPIDSVRDTLHLTQNVLCVMLP